MRKLREELRKSNSFTSIFMRLASLVAASCFAGVAIIIVMMPVTKKVGKVLGGMSKRLMKVKDERLKMNNEVLSGVKVIKQMAWEKR